MTEKLLIGTKQYEVDSLKGDAYQELLRMAEQNNHQVFCLCTAPKPLLKVVKSQGQYCLCAIESNALVQHDPSCKYHSTNSHEGRVEVDTFSELLDSLWVKAQLNVWAPKMASGRSYPNVRSILLRAAEHLTYNNKCLSGCLKVPCKEEKSQKGITLGLLEKIESNKIKLKFDSQLYSVEKESLPGLRRALKCLHKNKDLRIICIFDSRSSISKISYNYINRTFLPVNGVSITKSLSDVRGMIVNKKRFYMNEVKEPIELTQQW